MDIGTWLNDNAGMLAALGVGGYLGTQSGSSPAGTTTSESAPWSAAQPYLTDLFTRAKAQSLNPAVSEQMNSAYSGMKNANNLGLANQAAGVIGNTLNTNPNNYYGIGKENPYIGDNPYLQSTIDSASQDAMRNMNPMFQAQQRASGSYGNTGLSEAQTRQAASTLGNIATNARMQNYNQSAQLAENQINRDVTQYNTGVNNLNNAAFNTPGFNQSNMNNYGTQFNAANMMNNAQWQPLQNYGNLITGAGGSTQTNPYFTNPTAGLLGGAYAGSQIYNSLFK